MGTMNTALLEAGNKSTDSIFGRGGSLTGVLVKAQEILKEATTEYVRKQIGKDKICALKDFWGRLNEEYDLELVDERWEEIVVDEEIGQTRWVKRVYRYEPTAILRTLRSKRPTRETIIEAMQELHERSISLFYDTLQVVFGLNGRTRYLLEFYDATLWYVTRLGDKYVKAHLLSQDYFQQLFSVMDVYFAASEEDVLDGLRRLGSGINYVDEIVLQKINTALELNNPLRAFVHIAQALCTVRAIFVTRNEKLRYERRMIV